MNINLITVSVRQTDIVTLLTQNFTTMAEKTTIQRVTASEAAISKVKSESFILNSFLVPDGQEIEIVGVTFYSHTVDGVDKKTAVPCLLVKQGATETPLYLRSFLRSRTDYKDVEVPVTGTFNLYVRSLMGKTIGEVESELNTHKGKKLKAKITEYRGVNRNGDIQTISFNQFDKVGW